jgi:hypothetical protein
LAKVLRRLTDANRESTGRKASFVVKEWRGTQAPQAGPSRVGSTAPRRLRSTELDLVFVGGKGSGGVAGRRALIEPSVEERRSVDPTRLRRTTGGGCARGCSAASPETIERLTDQLIDSRRGSAHHRCAMSTERHRRLRPGDTVEVRPPAEILATLDADGALDSVPFMPEMLRYVGRRFTVSKRVEKICDTVAGTGGSLRMRGTVFLDDLRCDGSGHGGCQAGCRIYWKERWLRRVDDTEGAGKPEPAPEATKRLEERVRRGSRVVRAPNGRPPAEVYRCQATEAFAATTPLKLYDPGQYLREIASGNVSFRRFLRVATRAVTQRVGRKLGVTAHVPIDPQGDGHIPAPPLALQPGDWVEVKSAEEIALTLDRRGRNRGLVFDTEMLPYCGRTFRVRDRVQRIINEATGEMIEMKHDCLILDGVVCSGDRSAQRWFCPRAIYPFWREEWLRRIEAPTPTAGI